MPSWDPAPQVEDVRDGARDELNARPVRDREELESRAADREEQAEGWVAVNSWGER